MLHHCLFYWSSVQSCLANCFLIIGDHFRLHFYNIRQCQLTISWVAMVTCGPIVFPKVLWMQHLRIIFDSNALDMMQVFKSIPIVANWNKTEIAQYFHKLCFFYIYYQIENMNRKGIMLVKASEGIAMLVWFHTAPPTRHGQNHHQSAIRLYKLAGCLFEFAKIERKNQGETDRVWLLTRKLHAKAQRFWSQSPALFCLEIGSIYHKGVIQMMMPKMQHLLTFRHRCVATATALHAFTLLGPLTSTIKFRSEHEWIIAP